MPDLTGRPLSLLLFRWERQSMRQHRFRGLWGNFRKLIWKLPGWVFSARSSPDLVNKCCKAVIEWKSTDRCLLIQKRFASVGPKRPASQETRGGL